MKRIFIIISLLSLACAAKAENDFYTEFKQEVTEALKYVDKEQFTTGLLSDYGFSWVDLKYFGQIYDDSVWVNYDCWKAIYGGLYDSRVNSNVDMPELETVISSLEKNKSVGILYYKYDCFREDALEEGLITNDDGYIRIVDGKPSPFEQRECFAVSPPINRQDGLTLSLLFKKDTYYTNTDKTIVGIEVDFDGTGYKSTEWDKPITHTYTSEGAKEIKFRILMTADTRVMTYESKCVVSVKQKPSGPSRTQTQLSISHKDIPSDGSHAGGVMEIVYAANGALGGETFIRPLIIVGDMDLSALSPDLKMTLEKLLGTGGISPSLTQLNKMFDIIYINYNNGLDDLIRNGEMVRQAIKKIQANQSSFGCDQSYVIGLGMGGVVARIALNKMEQAGENQIETEGDISPCLIYAVGDPVPFDSIPMIIIPGIVDHLDINPTAYEPGGDPIPLDPIEPEPFLVPGPNAAIFTMPQVDDDEIASGFAYCDVSDDYGRKIRIGYFMQSEWNAVCGTYSVSPNPAGERLEVRMTVEGDPAGVTADAPVTALLYSGTGLVAKETFADIRSGGSLDVSHLPEGTYYLNIEANGTVVDRQVVLIQR